MQRGEEGTGQIYLRIVKAGRVIKEHVVSTEPIEEDV